MSKLDPTVETARISARQAIVVASITGIVSIVGTLVGTGNLTPRRSEGTASSSVTSATSRAPVLDAPQLSFVAKDTSSTLDECMEKARGALGRGQLTGVESGQHYAWGYRGETIGYVWCHTDARQVIFMAAGKNPATSEETRVILERSF